VERRGVDRQRRDSLRQPHGAILPDAPRATQNRFRRLDFMGRGVAVVTGASSGIGAATVRRLAQDGYDVVAAARRADRLEALAAQTGARPIVLDVTDEESVQALASSVENCRVLVNNAGGAFGLAAVAEADDGDWQRMWDVNVMGTMRMTRALLPQLEASG